MAKYYPWWGYIKQLSDYLGIRWIDCNRCDEAVDVCTQCYGTKQMLKSGVYKTPKMGG